MRFVLALFVMVPIAGCDILGDVELPLDLTSPPVDFEVDPAVAEAEGSACSTPDAESCVALRAICETEVGRDCTTPSMPDEFPIEVEVTPGNTANANELMDLIGIREATEVEIAMPVDVASALADAGGPSPENIKNVTIDTIFVEWPENTLTFDTPPIDVYIAPQNLGEGAIDAEALIADGTVRKVGTIGVNNDDDPELDVGQAAGSTDPTPLNFVDGGNEIFNEAVKGATFTLVTAVADDNGLKLKTKDGDPGTALKPRGAAKMRLKATLVFTVSASDIISGS